MAGVRGIGIDAVHTGPVKRAGGLLGWEATPSVDGHFDRISTEIDEVFGTEEEFRTHVRGGRGHGGIVIDDIVPGHTGKGADFRLAEMKVGDYPGIYHMVEIPPRGLAPAAGGAAPARTRSTSTPRPRTAGAGRLHHRPDAAGDLLRARASRTPTGAPPRRSLGPDGVERRWVYLHYFKEGQPSINWLDPTSPGCGW